MHKCNVVLVYLLLKHVVLLKNGKNTFTFGLKLPKRRIRPKKASNKFFGIEFRPRGHMSIRPAPHPKVELGGSKDDMVEILNCTEMDKYIHFWAELWPPLVTGLPGLHDNAASAAIRIHVKWIHLWKIVKKTRIESSVWKFFHQRVKIVY